MGNQGHSTEGMRQTVELIQAGAIGQVQEVKLGSAAHAGIQRLPVAPKTKPLHKDWTGTYGSGREPNDPTRHTTYLSPGETSGLLATPTSETLPATTWMRLVGL